MQRKKWISLLLMIFLLFSSSVTVVATRPELYGTDDASTKPLATLATPSVNLVLQYDGAYAQRYSNTITRITNHANALKNYYRQHFGITVNVWTPIAYTSYADTCTTSYTQTCSHAGDTACANSTLNTSGTLVLKQYHHNNIYNVCLRIPEPTNTTSVKMTFVGHKICGQYTAWQMHMDDICKGLAYPAKDIMTVNNFDSEASERITAIHEFGHMFGVLDHYGDQCPTTATMKAQDGRYDSNCIYGENRYTSTVMNNVTICGGCRNLITLNANKYS